MRSLVLIASLVLLPAFACAQSTEALQIFEKAVEASANGDHPAAYSGFRRVLGIIERDNASDAFFAKVHYNAGASLFNLSRMEEAAEHLKKGLRYTKGTHAKAHHLLGLIRLEMDQLRLAEQSLRSSVALDNRNGGAWYDLSRLYVALNEPERARSAYSKAVRNGALVSRPYVAQQPRASSNTYE